MVRGRNKKSRFITTTVFSIILMFFIFFAGCIGGYDLDKFIGTWEWTEGAEENTFTFYQNSSFYSYYINHVNNETHEGWGEYELESTNNTLHMFTSHGEGGETDSEYYDYEFYENDSQLTLTSSEGQTVELTKVK